jgi:hypothetical protein
MQNVPRVYVKVAGFANYVPIYVKPDTNVWGLMELTVTKFELQGTPNLLLATLHLVKDDHVEEQPLDTRLKVAAVVPGVDGASFVLKLPKITLTEIASLSRERELLPRESFVWLSICSVSLGATHCRSVEGCCCSGRVHFSRTRSRLNCVA